MRASSRRKPRTPALSHLLVLVAGCGTSERLDAPATPLFAAAVASVPPADAPATPPAPAPPVTTPHPPAAEPPPPAPLPSPTDASSLVGWWRGRQVCLELFANGDFELSILGHGPKYMVIGGAAIAPEADGAFALRLATAQVWRARFTGPCRKVHQTGGWEESQDALGVTFAKGATATMKLRRTGEAQVELCGERCETLTRDTPVLGGRWRKPGLEYPDRPKSSWTAGELLELDIDDQSGHVWAALDAKKWGTAYGQATAAFLAADRFTVTFTATFHADVPDGITPRVFGAPVGVGARLTLTARRLPAETLEVCGEDGRCTTLERQFDAYDHDLR